MVNFWEKHIKNHCDQKQQEKFDLIKLIINDFDLYINIQLDKHEKYIDDLKKENTVITVLCPNLDCGNLSFDIIKEKEVCKCFICGTSLFKTNYINNIRELEILEQNAGIQANDYSKTCSICNSNKRIKYEISDNIHIYYCLECFHKEIDKNITIEEFINELKSTRSESEIKENFRKYYKIIKQLID